MATWLPLTVSHPTQTLHDLLVAGPSAGHGGTRETPSKIEARLSAWLCSYHPHRHVDYLRLLLTWPLTRADDRKKHEFPTSHHVVRRCRQVAFLDFCLFSKLQQVLSHISTAIQTTSSIGTGTSNRIKRPVLQVPDCGEQGEKR